VTGGCIGRLLILSTVTDHLAVCLQEANKALAKANEKLLRGRKLVVTFAQQAPSDQIGSLSSGSKPRRGMMDTSKPTTLSLLKTGMGTKQAGMNDKIAMMEAKLRQMEASRTALEASHSSLPSHPSLPAKPALATPAEFATTSQPQRVKRPAKPLPSLPILPKLPRAESSVPQLVTPVPRQERKAGIPGVKITKGKEKQT